jgi:2-polyprenyl-3-methyl-5-hydroxy-6-metoxy-1,4-benzoquinol methylase
MTDTARKWDEKYAQVSPKKPIAAAWVLQQHLAQLPLKGRALDLACGLGGNARLMARCGLTVAAWDISDVALTQLNNWAAVNRLPIHCTLCDFEQMLFPYQQYDVITVSRYLNRALWPQIAQALRPGGKLFIQTFLAPVQSNAPQTPDFYLRPGELTQLTENGQVWSNFTVEVHGEGWLADGDQAHRYAWLIATKPAS